MTDCNDIPKVKNVADNVGGRGYTLTDAQKKRRARGQSIYNRDRQVEEYKVSKGEWV
jgi:hypothetical protein